MQQNPKVVVAGSRFLVVCYQLLVTALSAQIVASKIFPQYAQGVIDNPVLSTTVVSVMACAVICHKQLVCHAFSTKRLSIKELQCLISLGEFQWTPDPDGELFGDYIRNIDGYHFGRDGYLYKLFTDTPKDLAGSRLACRDVELGALAVPYPAFKYQALRSTPGVSNSNTTFYLGVYKNTTNTSETIWVTNDVGVFFDTKNMSMDLDQKWSPMHPNPTRDWMAGLGSGTWDATNGTPLRQYLCRKSVVRYIRSPANDRIYYWASNFPVNHALAQKRCEADGGTLAIITQIAEVAATEAFRASVRGISMMNEGADHWVAGTDVAMEGTWVISASTTLYLADRHTDPFQKQFFAAGSPTNNTLENCLAMGPKGAVARRCTWNRRFLCQITLL